MYKALKKKERLWKMRLQLLLEGFVYFLSVSPANLQEMLALLTDCKHLCSFYFLNPVFHTFSCTLTFSCCVTN